MAGSARAVRKSPSVGPLPLAAAALAFWLGPSPLRSVFGGMSPLPFSPEGRARVRGDYPENASVRMPWRAPAFVPDEPLRQALWRFEAGGSESKEPDRWMEGLVQPDLPIRWRPALRNYLRFFVRDPQGQRLMAAWLRQAGRYEGLIRRILREHGVPEDLVWIVMAESGFNPRARSARGAAGPWQMVPATAQVYGLKSEYWVDDRYDVQRSSHAAALYLRDLKVRFGSWELALAAYNAGHGLILTAIQRHNTNNFWALVNIEGGLPHATARYVPKILAAAIVARNREKLGFGPKVVEPLPPLDVTEVILPHSTSIGRIARAIDEPKDLLEELNARYVRARTPPRGRWPVRVPKAKAARLHQSLAAFERDWSQHTVILTREGESLEQLAQAHNLTERQLRALNGIADAAEIRRGVELLVPVQGAPTEARGQAGNDAGDQDNATRPLVAVPLHPPGPDHRLVFVRVARGSTAEDLASSFGVSWPQIVAWNDLDPLARLQAGQILQVVVPRDFDPAQHAVRIWEASEVDLHERGSASHIDASLALRGKQRRAVTAKRGESLESIGRRYDLTTGDLARINQIPRDHRLTPGDVIIVYVPEKKTRGTTKAPPTTSPAGLPATSGTAPATRP